MAHLIALQHRLAAILAADIVGYSRLMEEDEESTFSWQRRLRVEVLDPGIAAYAGRLVKNTGDGFVAVFDSVNGATRCALALQQALGRRTAELPPERRISFRMAVNLAEIIVEEDDVYGDGVNVAARLQSYAEPGGVIVSGAVAEQLGAGLGLGAIDLGELSLRNRARPVRMFALRMPDRPIGEAQAGGCDAEDPVRPRLVVTAS